MPTAGYSALAPRTHPATWVQPSIPVLYTAVELPNPPIIGCPILAQEYATLKDTLNARANIETARFRRRPSNYDIDRLSNKSLEMAGDSLLRWLTIKITRKRFPQLVAAGIAVGGLRKYRLKFPSIKAQRHTVFRSTSSRKYDIILSRVVIRGIYSRSFQTQSRGPLTIPLRRSGDYGQYI